MTKQSIQILPVRLFGDPVLKRKASPVTSFGSSLKELAESMVATMYEYNGVGLAGPQVGIAKRIFVALETNKDDADDNEDKAPPKSLEEKRERWGVIKEHVIINPKLSNMTGQAHDIEGCLSIPGLYVEDVERNLDLKLEYQDVEGNHHSLEASGHFARVIQHEYDHLEGIMFLDRLAPMEKRGFMNEHRNDLAEMQREAKAFLKDIKRQVLPPEVS